MTGLTEEKFETQFAAQHRLGGKVPVNRYYDLLE